MTKSKSTLCIKELLLVLTLFISWNGASQNRNEIEDSNSSAQKLFDKCALEIDSLINFYGTVGAAIVIIDNGSLAIKTVGVQSKKTKVPVTPKTLFEVGSISKVFTGLLLMDAIDKGEVTFHNTVKDLLPQEVSIRMSPSVNEISLLSLATMRSGLPRNIIPMPDGVDYATAIKQTNTMDVYNVLQKIDVTDNRVSWAYSNGGFELLGHLLEKALNQDYSQMIKERIVEPLGMKNTVVHMPDSEKNLNVPEGYVWFGFNDIRQTPSRGRKGYFYNAFSPASGAIVSTAEDMGIYLNALLKATALSKNQYERTLARSAYAYTKFNQFKSNNPRSITGYRVHSSSLGWNIETLNDHVYFLKDGQTFQFQSYMIVSPTKNRAMIILMNTAGNFTGMMQVVNKIMYDN